MADFKVNFIAIKRRQTRFDNEIISRIEETRTVPANSKEEAVASVANQFPVSRSEEKDGERVIAIVTEEFTLGGVTPVK